DGAGDDDKDVLAAEYVLGTLDADDRANAQMLMAIDPAFAASIAAWERRLGELHALVEPVEPAPANWEWIKARTAVEPQSGRVWLPDAADAAASAPPPPVGAGGAAWEAPAGSAEVARLASRERRWQRIAVAAGAVAASIVGIAALRDLRPLLLPEALRPRPFLVEKPVEVVRQVEVVREVASPRTAEYVAVFQRDDSMPSPSFILSIDVERKTVSVRRVDAQMPSDKAYELWIATAQAPQPRSLGLLTQEPFTVKRALADYDAPTITNATFGISLEPAGGSPTGQPTGPVLHGKLIQATPAAFPSATP
ncbi:MAG: anti-sigma factor, partial [Variibacter sp.]|nr:anti-sigma factor [Variibacter sp.]